MDWSRTAKIFASGTFLHSPDSRIPNSRIPNSRIPDSKFQIEFQIPDSRFQNSRIPDSRISNSRIPDSRFRIPDSKFQNPDSGALKNPRVLCIRGRDESVPSAIADG
ncbi:MAG: hypothetical protein IPK58_22920 [Acidobacteria bacterium]|nr:hypothetical protein [Acidobacteriota bacterium]